MDEREEKCIDFVIRAIENRLKQKRGNVWCPETTPQIPRDQRIDAVAEIGEQKFAFEHTMIEPYEGHHKQGVVTHKAETHLRSRLEGLDLNIGIDIALPNNWSDQYPRQKQRQRFITALASLVREKLSDIELLKDDDRFFNIGKIDEISIKVVRNNFEEMDDTGTLPYLILIAGDFQNGRIGRLRRSLDDKLPKLIRWGKDHQTVLILENRDISLTGWHSVRPVIEGLWNESGVIPVDYLYFVNATINKWRLLPFVEEGKWSIPKPSSLVRVDRIDKSELSSPFF